MKKVLLLFLCLLATILYAVQASAQTSFGSGGVKSTIAYDASTQKVIITINHEGDLASCSDSPSYIDANYSIDGVKINGKDLTIITGEGVTLTKEDVAKVPSLTYNGMDNVYDFSKASLPVGVKLSETLIISSGKFQTKGFVFPLNYEELATEFGATSFVMYSDGTTAKLVSKGTGFSKAAEYLGSCQDLTITGNISENIDYSSLSSLKTLDVSAATIKAGSTITLPETIEKVKVLKGFDVSNIFPETIREKVEEVIPKEDPYVKNGNALTVNLEEGMDLRDVLNQADMPFLTSLTIKTVGGRTLNAEDVEVINDVLFKDVVDGNVTTKGGILDLSSCDIEDYSLLSSLSNNASTEEEVEYTGIKSLVLPKDMAKIDGSWFANSTSLCAAISLSENGTAANAYVNQKGKLSELTSNSSILNVENIRDWTMSGHLNNADIRPSYVNGKYGTSSTTSDDGEGSGALGTIVNSFDLTNAIFDDGEMRFNQYQKYITSVKFPTSPEMTKIPDCCMMGCTQVKSIFIPGNYESLGEHAFDQAGIETVTSGVGVRHLGKYCFQNCTSLTQVALPVGMETVGAYSFVGCTALKDLAIPYGVTTIEEHAFENLDALTSVRLPYTLKTIGDYAFSDCNKIQSITIPENVETIGDGAFALTNSLKDVYVLGTKTIPTIVDAGTDGDGNKHVGSFDELTLYNSGGTHNKTTATQEDYWRNKDDATGAIGNGAAFLHFPKGYEEQYTDAERNNAFHATLVDDSGNTVLDEDGNAIKVPNGQDVAGADSWVGVSGNTGWKRFMLTKGGTTGNDNSRVWTIRHMYDDTWYTMCFPFDLTINQLVETFGSGFEIAYFCGVQKEGNNMVLQFTVSNYMKEEPYTRIGAAAGVPYMIHPNTGVGNSAKTGKRTVFVFSGVDPDFTREPIGKVGYDYFGTGPTSDPNGYDHSYTFIGSYGEKCKVGDYFVDKHNEYADDDANGNPVLKYEVGNTGNYKKAMPEDLLVPRAIPENYYFLGLAANATYPKYYRESRVISFDMDNSTPDKTYRTGLWTRFTAMVKAKDAEGQETKKSLGISFGEFDDDTVITGINIVDASGQQREYIDLTNHVYNLNGQVVRSNSQDVAGLPAGVYIVKGKKIVVK